MFLRGRGIKANIVKAITRFVKYWFPVGSIYNAPGVALTSWEVLSDNRTQDILRIVPVFSEKDRVEVPPEIFNHNVSGRFTRYYSRKIPAAYTIELSRGIVYGRETNFIITPSQRLLSDVSREFGMYGGKPMAQSSVITSTLQLPAATHLDGKVAVITTSGANNFHHWNYDCIPRLHLLKQAGLLQKTDRFLISYNHLPFQKESLRLLGIDEESIINPLLTNDRLFQADILYIPSLPSKLGTVSPWVVDFLRNLYNPGNEKKSFFKRIYLSRKNVTSRKIKNNEEFISLLLEFGFTEVFPEDYPVSEMAKILADADFIISVHGSGLSNLCFVSDNTTVIDILAPYHQDGYYWMICNIRNSRYVGFFAEGEHPADDVDLVKNKIDEDLYLNLQKMRLLLSRENILA